MDALGVDISEERWTVAHLESGLLSGGAVATFVIEGEAGERAEKLRAYIKEKRRVPSIALAFPEKDCLLKVISLPSTGTRAVSKMLGFELERHLPSDAEDWLWSHVPIANERASAAIMLSAVRSAPAEAVLSVLNAAGLTPSVITSGQAALAEALRRSGFLPGKGLSAVVSARQDRCTLQVFRGGVLEYSSGFELRTAQQALSFALSYVKEAPASFFVIDEGLSEDTIIETFLEEARAYLGQARVFGPVPALSRAFGAALIASEKKTAGPAMADMDVSLQARKRAMGAAVACTLAVFIGGGAVAVKDIIALKKVEKKIAGLGEERIRADTLMSELDHLTRDMNALEEISGASSPVFLDTLRRLTELTPEDTYLTGLEYGRDSITVDGVSQRASGLFMSLSRSGFAEDINYDGPVLRGQDGKERFRIKFRNSGGHGDGQARLGS